MKIKELNDYVLLGLSTWTVKSPRMVAISTSLLLFSGNLMWYQGL